MRPSAGSAKRRRIAFKSMVSLVPASSYRKLIGSLGLRDGVFCPLRPPPRRRTQSRTHVGRAVLRRGHRGSSGSTATSIHPRSAALEPSLSCTIRCSCDRFRRKTPVSPFWPRCNNGPAEIRVNRPIGCPRPAGHMRRGRKLRSPRTPAARTLRAAAPHCGPALRWGTADMSRGRGRRNDRRGFRGSSRPLRPYVRVYAKDRWERPAFGRKIQCFPLPRCVSLALGVRHFKVRTKAAIH
jgi:hypothetical protein